MPDGVVVRIITPRQINVTACRVCRVGPGEPHRDGCPYPGVAATHRSEIWSVTRCATTPAESHLEDTLEACNVKALEAWIRSGRLL